jgi:hypothetical protein
MPLVRWKQVFRDRRRRTRRSKNTHPGLEPLEGRALLSHVQLLRHIKPLAVHAAETSAAVSSGANAAYYWQPLRSIDGKVILPGPSIISSRNEPRLVQVHLVDQFITPPKGVVYLYYGNHNVGVYELQHMDEWKFIQQKHGPAFVQFTTFQGENVPVLLTGTVVKVVRNWTPASPNPDGDKVIIRTVFPNGSVAYVKYEHLQSDIPVRVGDRVTPASMIGLVGRTGAIPATGPTNLTIVCWTPQGGGRYLQPVGTPDFFLAPNGGVVAVLPVTHGCSPTFVDTDQGAKNDDPDNDSDDPGGICG